MGMPDIVDKIEAETGLTRYKLAKELNKMGISVSNPTALKYGANEGSQGIRLPLLAGLFILCKKKGVTAAKFMGWIIEEFLPGGDK